MRCISWTVLGIAFFLAGISGCGGHDLWWQLSPSDPGGSWLQLSNDAGFIGSQTGDYRTHH